MKNIWLIFGCSPFISEIKGDIPRLLEKYNSIGINLFPKFYPGCDYWIFNDSGIFTNIVRHNYQGQKLIINKKLETELKTYWFRPKQCIIRNNFLIQPEYIFEVDVNSPVLIDNGKLFGVHSTVLQAINFALIKGAREVILLGIDLNPEWDHFYCKKSFHKSGKHIEKIKKQIDMFKPYLNIYKANPLSSLDLETIDIELL